MLARELDSSEVTTNIYKQFTKYHSRYCHPPEEQHENSSNNNNNYNIHNSNDINNDKKDETPNNYNRKNSFLFNRSTSSTISPNVLQITPPSEPNNNNHTNNLRGRALLQASLEKTFSGVFPGVSIHPNSIYLIHLAISIHLCWFLYRYICLL